MFSGGQKSGTCMHFEEYAQLVDCPAVSEILESIWGSPDFVCHSGGGDFCLPGSEYQPLHSDMGMRPGKTEFDADGLTNDIVPYDAAERPGFTYSAPNGFIDPSGKLDMRDLPCPSVNVNFLPRAFTSTNGATRFIAGSQNSHGRIPTLKDEPLWMRTATASPLPAGSAVFRDQRTWHGGTPNVSDEPRPMASAML